MPSAVWRKRKWLYVRKFGAPARPTTFDGTLSCVCSISSRITSRTDHLFNNGNVTKRKGMIPCFQILLINTHEDYVVMTTGTYFNILIKLVPRPGGDG
jgi:hypothetical protein